MNRRPAVTVAGLQKTYRSRSGTVPALRGISFSAPERAVTCIVGPDGAGKSTLLRALLGLVTRQAGEISVFGRDPAREADAVRKASAFVPQSLGIHDELTVTENLRFFADLYGVPAKAAGERLPRLLRVTGLEPFPHRRADALSGGMRQKLALACALLHEPRLLLLDEPSVGVDPLSRREIWAWMRDEVAAGRTVLWTTTSLDEAARADHVVLVLEGRTVDEGPPDRFVDAARGRVFRAVARGPRQALAGAIAADPAVLDVAPRSGALVVLVREGRPPRLPSEEVEIEPAAPTLEDAVVLRLLESGEALRSEPPIFAPAARPAGDGPVIWVRDLVRAFGSFRAVDGISFEVRRGEVFGLLGPNGAGKTTTFRMLCGLLPPTSGTARIEGIDLRRAAPRARARVGYMAQRFSLYRSLSPRANLLFFAKAYGVPAAERDERIEAALRAFDLLPVADRRADSLSYGHRRRLSLAAALLHGPSVLFLDEPTSGADPIGRRAFWRTILALADRGVTVLVTTHHLDEAESCDRIAIMHRGRIVALGTPDEVRRRALGDPHAPMDDVFVAVVEGRDAAA